MEFSELEQIVKSMVSLQEACTIKKLDFKKRGMSDLMEQSQGEALGIGKCISIIGGLYPEEVKAITHHEETQEG